MNYWSWFLGSTTIMFFILFMVYYKRNKNLTEDNESLHRANERLCENLKKKEDEETR